ncbi:hypothetical protein F5B20DRAFT_16984 [Whalleya microplaca]|nr:hypothetical protein F5B20DRAFT_16984 [Whalleya microplaca]
MVIRLHDRFLSACFHHQPDCSMALAGFDYRSQIRDNCEFFVGKDEFVSVITTKKPAGGFKAYAIRTSEESRDALLFSDVCDSHHSAIQSLHTKSCEAVQQYITTNGFSHPPDLKKTKLVEDENDGGEDDNEDAASVVSGRSVSSTVALSDEWGSSDEEALTPASLAGNHSHHARRNKSTRSKKETNHHTGNVNYVVPRGKDPRPPHPRYSKFPYDFDYSDDDNDRQHQQPRPRTPPGGYPTVVASNRSNAIRVPPSPPGQMVVGPPPPMRGLPIHPGHGGPAPIQGPGPGPSPPQPSGPIRTSTGSTHFSNNHNQHSHHANNNTVTVANRNNHSLIPSSNAITIPQPNPNPGLGNTHPHPQQTRLYDVRLAIRWAHHGEQRVLESSRASIRALQDAAVAYVRAHLGAFEGVTAADRERVWSQNPPNANGPNGNNGGLRAVVRTAYFGTDAYDMRTYRGDDLSKLFAVLSAGGIPRFEIDVDFVRGVEWR